MAFIEIHPPLMQLLLLVMAICKEIPLQQNTVSRIEITPGNKIQKLKQQASVHQPTIGAGAGADTGAAAANAAVNCASGAKKLGL